MSLLYTPRFQGQSMKKLLLLLILPVLLFSCAEDPEVQEPNNPSDPDTEEILAAVFGDNIDLDDLANYANQAIPNYITKDNTAGNPITDAGATLGRVLFYDKNLSIDNSVSCSSCHAQEHGFSDITQASMGVNGSTARHSMRLVNARFGDETNFFWDERAPTLEFQTTQPIQDHVEMGFSGEEGNPDFAGVIDRLEGLAYYNELFTFVFGDQNVTEDRIQLALAQFVRSIQSFDSKFDEGRALTGSNLAPFANFTAEENQGKTLFLTFADFGAGGIREGEGLGCGGCHRAPEFDITPNLQHNGVIAALDGGVDDAVTRSPSLRDIFKADGSLNGELMHTGDFDIDEVLDHYNNVPDVPGLDIRLRPGGIPQQLNITADERSAVIAFLHTLTGTAMYTDARWSDPFLD